MFVFIFSSLMQLFDGNRFEQFYCIEGGLVLLLITYYFMHILIIMNTIDYNDLGDLFVN